MDLNLFATQIVQTNGKASSAVLGGGGLLGGASGLGSVSVDFWNVILGNLAEEQTDLETKTKNQNLELKKEDGIKKETVDLALLQLALLGQDPDVNLDEKLASLRIERQALSQENRVEQLTKLINHLTSGLPKAVDENTNVAELVSRLTKRLENLESSLEAFRTGDFGNEGAPFKLLIATGLNPAQITRITNRIEEVETKLGRELTAEDLIAGVGNIIPAPGDDDHEFSTADALSILINKSNEQSDLNDLEDSDLNNQNNFDQDLKDDLAVTLSSLNLSAEITDNKTDNNDVVRGKKSSAQKSNELGSLLNMVAALKVAPAGTPSNGLTPTTDQTADSETITALPQQLSNTEFNALFTSTNSANSAKKNIAKLNISNLVQNSSLPTLPKLGDISLPTSWKETFSAQNTLTDSLGFDIQTGAPFTATMLATHSASAVPQAGQTHPATQMVAAHISKAAQTGDTRNITLKLDPPELGRVEIRLEFGKEKSVKAHLMVEKPETLLMLQRDASALERALQNAGLDTDSGSLNYQMASDDAFNSNNSNQNGSNSGTGTENARDSGEQEDLLETTLTWDVDAETGHVRYNIIA